LTTNKQRRPGDASLIQDAAIRAALSAIHRAPRTDWTIGLMARKAGLTKAVFVSRFRETTGKPPHRYLMEYRMALACQLLRDTEFTQYEIAQSVGYETTASFTAAFRRCYGKSPVQYRRDEGSPDASSEPVTNQ